MDFFDFVPVTTPNTQGGIDMQEQIARIPELENQRSALEAQAAAARTKRTKRGIAIQINSLTAQINDLKRKGRLMRQPKPKDDEATETKPTPGGAETDKVLQKPAVNVSQTVKTDDVLSTAQPESTKKKPNYLLFAGIGIGLLVVIGLVFASKNSNK